MFRRKMTRSNEGESRIWKRMSLISRSFRVRTSLSSSTETLTSPLVDSHESVLIMLQNAEQQVEELKLQLDDALGAEEMLVQLTERNLMLSEVLVYAKFHPSTPL